MYNSVYICLILSLFALILQEGFFYLNFSPLSISSLGHELGFNSLVSFILFFLLLFLILIVIAIVIKRKRRRNISLIYCLLLSLIVYLIINLILSFYDLIYEKMNFLAQISLLTWTIFVFYTFFYSIFYDNLLE